MPKNWYFTVERVGGIVLMQAQSHLQVKLPEHPSLER